jgi:serpin B
VTKGKIKDLIPPGAVNPGTRMVLTNAVYFKGDWEWRFRERATRPAPFAISTTEKIDVPMMTQSSRFKTASFDKFRILEMDYVGKEVSMTILLPRDVAGLDQLERTITAEAVEQWRARLEERELEVSLPKFKITSKFELAGVLQQLGMRLPFTGEADFSGMSPRHDLMLSRVIHQAYLSVDERGTEAAAGTALQSLRMFSSGFRVDHPFVLLIRDRKTGTITFLGRVINPLQ